MGCGLKKYLFYGFLVLLLSGCGGLKYLPEEERLLTAHEIELENGEKIHNKGELQNYLEISLRPEPDPSFMGLRPRLWIYLVMVQPKRKKGIGNWIKNKVGRPPVLLSDASPENTAMVLRNKLENRGYFQAEVDYEVIPENAKKARVYYTATLHSPYTIKKVKFPPPETPLEQRILETLPGTLLKEGEPYNLTTLTDERVRIDRALKDQGYYYFNPEFLLFRVDSTVGEREVNLQLTIKKLTPETALRPYRLKDVYIHTQFDIRNASAADTLFIDGYHYLLKEPLFRPEVIVRYIALNKGQYYQRTLHNRTVRQLMQLGVFRFANIRFTDAGMEADTGLLNAHIQLTPMMKKSLRTELGVATKSNDFTGPGLDLSFRNRNSFGGAELFILSLESGFETQLGRRVDQPLNSYELGINGELIIPRFMSPFPVGKLEEREFIPSTRFKGGFRLLNRVEFFQMFATDFIYGYRWRTTATTEHELNPINFSFVNLFRTTPIFEELLERNPVLRRSFEEQFIPGAHYGYTYNTQIGEQGPKRHDFFFRTVLDLSGNLLHGAQVILRPEDAELPFRIFRQPYSQFTRVDFDSRYYFRPGENNRIATRLMAGAGIPYGNSTTMPFVKQFFIGGTNSIRAFQARSVGPGSYRPDPGNGRGIFFFDQTGDIRLEANIEYRFKMAGIFHGAFFTDAGNIWLIRGQENRPGGAFRPETFIGEVAVGTGFGLRIDVEFFVLRLDLGIPLRKPWLAENERWVIDRIRPGLPEWRRDNLVLNIGIGYPF